MLKKIYTKKIIISLAIIFALLLIYIMPVKKEYDYKEIVEYVNNDINTEDIYLLDQNNMLAKTKIVINNTELESKVKELLESLIIDSNKQDSIPNGFKAIIPSNTKILSTSYDNDVIKIDFSSELLNTKIDNEEKIIESIVYTLTSLDEIKYVIIYIDGKILTTLPKSNITLPSTLDRSYGINKEYNITSKDNIKKTTIYYISEFNNNEYYVPVTKVNNDEREKIEIIIDELSSSNVYKSNLMSFLNENTKLLSVNQNDDELIINFNSYIFNDINTKEILEEVIYTISLSVNDNYDVNCIIFNVDDEEIYKSVLKSIE